MPLFKKREVEERRALQEEYAQFLLEEQIAREPKTFYEKFCKFAEFLRIKPPKILEEKLKYDIIFSSLNATPTGVLSASLLSLFLFSFLVSFVSFMVFDIATLSFLSVLPIVLFVYIFTYPSFKAQVLRIQTGDEAIKIILYMVTYLKLTPVFEGAVNFTIAHTKGPITDDMKKAMWGLRAGKYKTVEEALGKYMPKWAVWNEDFIRSLRLLYGVLTEPTEKGRDEILRKALSFVSESTHLKMKKYVEDISSPLMMIHVMGLMLPVLGLVMFPMVSIFLHQQINIIQLVVGYVVILPLLNLFLIYRVLSKRPGAYIVPDISKHPELPKEDFFAVKVARTKILIPASLLAILVGLLVMLYGIFHFINLGISLSVATSEAKKEILRSEAEPSLTNLLSAFSIIAGFAIASISYFYLKSFQRIRIRNEIKDIESEFQLGLFSLGNFLSGGHPIEVAVSKSLEEYQKLGMQRRPVYGFFSRLLASMRDLGMTFKRALFDERYGILKFYPSVLIDNIMKILSDASEKSSVLLGTIAKTIAGYLENIYTIEARIRELLAETRSSIKIQSNFVVPLVCAMVGSLGVFILNMLRILALKLAEIERSLGLGILASGTEGFGSIIDALVGGFENIIPMTALNAIVGIYTVEVVILLSILLSGIENGFDKVARDHTTARSLIIAMAVYALVSFFAIVMFQSLGLIIEAG